MSDLRHEIDDIGRRIWPDTAAAHRAVQARRRHWWVLLLQPRRPRPGLRWLPVLAAVATAAIFLGIANGRPVQERTQGQGQGHAPVAPFTLDPGAPDGPGEALAPGHQVLVPTLTHRTRPAPEPAPAGTLPATGSGGGVSPSSPSSPSSGTDQDGVITVTLTEADAGRTVTITPGTRIVVNLQPPPHRRWSAPHALDSAILSTVESTQDGSTGAAHGTFVGSRAGRTRLVAGQGGCHGPLCLIASPSTWWVRIVVSR